MFYLCFISGVEVVFILLVVVMLFGAKRVPDIARNLGKGINQVRDATNEIKREIYESAEKHKFDESVKEIQKNTTKVKDSIVSKVTGSIKKT